MLPDETVTEAVTLGVVACVEDKVAQPEASWQTPGGLSLRARACLRLPRASANQPLGPHYYVLPAGQAGLVSHIGGSRGLAA